CAFIFVILIVAAKRAWGKAITLIVGGGIVVFFINKPDALKTIGTWLGGLFGV
ncbi:TcpD family membrane protein, partial [Bacillus cereus group sp. Bce025]